MRKEGSRWWEESLVFPPLTQSDAFLKCLRDNNTEKCVANRVGEGFLSVIPMIVDQIWIIIIN